MYPEPTELLLIGCVTELIWTPKIQIKYVDTKRQLADVLAKENFTRDELNHLLYLFQHQPFQLSLLRSEFQLDQLLPKRWRKGRRNREKETTGSWQSQSRRR